MDLFQHPAFLAWSALAAVGLAMFWAWTETRRRRLTEAFAKSRTLERLFPQEALARRRLKYALRAAAVTLMLLALAGPQWGVELVTSNARGIQAVIAVDTSLSMLAQDLKPDRLEKAKSALSQLIDGLKGNRVGLVAFSGEAQIQCPLTSDLEAAKNFLGRLRVGMIPQPGTAIAKAIRLAARMLGRYSGHKALVLLTDGEDFGGGTPEAAREAAQSGIQIFIIGIGTPEGEPIPLTDPSGRVTGYKKDPKGQTVITRLGESALMQLAASASGAYYRASVSESEVSDILRQILNLESSQIQSGSSRRYRNRFTLPLFLAFLLLLAEILFPELKPQKPIVPAAAKERTEILVMALAALLLSGCHPTSDLNLWRGNSQYTAGNFEEALRHYSRANAKDPRSLFNAGAALYKMGDFDNSQEGFAHLSDPKQAGPLTKSSTYNLGNTLYKKRQFKEAAEAYKRCLLMDWSDENCRYNLALALKPPPPSKDSGQGGRDKQQEKQDREQKAPPRPQASGGQGENSAEGMTKEDAERLLKAVKEKEKAQSKTQPQSVAPQGVKPPEPPGGADW